MKIVLKDLVLSNFKGVRDFSLVANGQNINVFGDNATGKTTLFDAFNWLLFDKDSSDSSKFQLKTVDKEGNVQHHLDHSVKASFLVDSRLLELQKVYREKWTKRRGSATSEFSGHTADYFMDGVPAQKKEFDAKVAELVRGKEELFKLLTSPTYFNEQFKWQQRRKVLLKICGDLTDEEVIAGSDKLKQLPEVLGDHSIEDLRKIISNKRSEINKELDRIPIRIDEAEKSKPDIDGKSEDELNKSVEFFQQQIELVDEEINRIRSGGEIDEKRNEKRKIEGVQLDLRNNFQKGIHEEIDEKRSEYYNEKSNYERLTRLIAERKEEIVANERSIKKNEEQAADLRMKWASENAKQFEFTGETVCPACGQELPAGRLEEAKAHAEAEFNRQKAQKLEEIQQRGKELVAEIKRLNKENDMNGVDVAQFGETANLTKQKMDKLQKKIDDLNAGTKSILDDSEFQKTQVRIKSIEAEIKALQLGIDDQILAASGKKQELKKQLNEAETSLLAFNSVRRIDKRITDLTVQEKALSKEYEELEKQLFLTEEFIKTKVNMLEEKINAKFNMARFKLFEEQVNGGLNEVCETTYNGVPYNALNNAAKINVGLDIINTLSEFYELSAPIFIDNREAVTRLIDVEAQVISLIVSEADKKLRVETERQAIEEAI